MRICLITGGEGIADEAIRLIDEDDRIVCADSGADYILRHGMMPDVVYGDMDSVSEEGKEALKAASVPAIVYPSHKDMTDTEIALKSEDSEAEILLICPLSGRIDHVITNLQIAMELHRNGRQISLTDGVTDVIPLSGPENIELSGLQDTGHLAVSLIPADMSVPVTGVTTSGLSYPLTDATINAGSGLTVSNSVIEGNDTISVSITSGEMFLVITDNRI